MSDSPAPTSDTSAETERGTTSKAPSTAIRTTERAKELGRLSGEARRAKAEQRRLAASSGASSSTHATDAAVIAQLERAAKGGDVQAARELRAWRELQARTGTGIKPDALRLAQLLTELSSETRARFAAWLEEGEQSESDHPDETVTPPLPELDQRQEATPASQGVPALAKAGGVSAHTQPENGGTAS